ncbi:AfsR/SARP family transcriptional regulator [Rhizohabitans arisaemae]|uniref:AfsR/SARP family transcriptional regulator n=1 Tax=Rhizohabitans arisaemae TaxID=2720610 RepID=UPI0024B0784E|nr:BTAD domain-containing putative transcriptional regulator [Rhizohabitans arisaemae]
MDFCILGVLEAAAGGRRLDLGGTRQQAVLATLLLHANRPVSIGRLTEVIYGDNPPATSRVQVQICISALRRMFTAHGYCDAIVTHSQGYLLQVDEERVDAFRFEDFILRARCARDKRDPGEAVTLFRQALGLWRGPALDGIESRLLQVEANRLNELRIAANEACIQLELDLGKHHELVGELTKLVQEHPLRERLVGQLMIALYRSGRQAEALQVYRNAHRVMIDELGIEPNERLQQLEYAILTASESLNLPDPPAKVAVEPAVGVPCMLPTGIADFTGRDRQITAIRRHLTTAPSGSARFAVPIIAIVGRAGIGKTTLAVHIAHDVAQHFPDGQLFADLHGVAPRAVSPMQVLERFLRVLGVPGNAIPDGLEERAETYRNLIADSRVLIVLDDVSGESQVLPLLPGNPQAAIIITSRSRLGGLAGVTHVDLDVFDAAHSMELLSRIAGVERVHADTHSASMLVDLCGRLPLALRIAGSRLAARPHWNIGQLAERLRDETRRLDELIHGEMGIRASISLTYEGLGDEARRLFRRLAILDSHVLPAWIAAPLLDQPFPVAQDLLDDLVDAQLIEVVHAGRGAYTQYQFHDLIRVFARERLAAEEPAPERTATLSRALSALLVLADAAQCREFGTTVPIPGEVIHWSPSKELIDRLIATPFEWFERERLVLVSGIRQAAQAGLVEICWSLAVAATRFFESRVYLDDWRETHEIAREATAQAGDRHGHAMVLYRMGMLSFTEQHFDDARRELETAMGLFTDIRDSQGFALATSALALMDRLNGRLKEAVDRSEQAIAIFRATGDHVSAAFALHSLAQLHLDCGNVEDAKRLLREALIHSRSGGNRRVNAQVLHRMGRAHLQAGEFALSVDAFTAALAIVRDICDTTGEAYVQHGLGMARLRQGERVAASRALHLALELATSAQQRLAEADALEGLGELALASGDPMLAASYFRQTTDLFQVMNMPLQEAQTLTLLCEACQAVGDDAAAEAAMARALQLSEGMDPRFSR